MGGVTVQLAGEEGVLATAATDQRGRYAFDAIDGLRAGNYVVQMVGEDGQVMAASETIAITNGAQSENRCNIAVPPR